MLPFWITKKKKKNTRPTHKGRLNSSKHTHKQEISLLTEGIFPSYNGVQRCVIIQFKTIAKEPYHFQQFRIRDGFHGLSELAWEAHKHKYMLAQASAEFLINKHVLLGDREGRESIFRRQMVTTVDLIKLRMQSLTILNIFERKYLHGKE